MMSDRISLFDVLPCNFAEEKFMSPAHVSALGEIGRGRFFFSALSSVRHGSSCPHYSTR